jgi:hypothetical protein
MPSSSLRFPLVHPQLLWILSHMPQFAAISGNFTRGGSGRFSLLAKTSGISHLSKITRTGYFTFAENCRKLPKKKSR